MAVRDQNAYEDLLASWADLESGLGMVLAHPQAAPEWLARLQQYDRWMQTLVQRDPDAGLYLLFQLAGNSPVGYSASHALVCAVLSHLIAGALQLPPSARDSLVRAALTMNVAMTALQDTLATQSGRPSPAQQESIRRHPAEGTALLQRLGVQDSAWLEAVAAHHEPGEAPAPDPTAAATPLVRILQMVDRYAAMISPRQSRAGRSAAESAQAVLAAPGSADHGMGQALVRVVGLYPPGSFVRMDSGALGVVVRTSDVAQQPYVALVGGADGQLLAQPRLHATALGAPGIATALPASVVQAHLNHFQILSLGYQVPLRA